MDFQIWKTEMGKGTSKPYYSYSIREVGKEVPVILEQDHFSRLFPETDCEAIPSAPSSTVMEIQAILK